MATYKHTPRIFFILHVYNIGLEDLPQLVPRTKLAQHPGPSLPHRHPDSMTDISTKTNCHRSHARQFLSLTPHTRKDAN